MLFLCYDVTKDFDVRYWDAVSKEKREFCLIRSCLSVVWKTIIMEKNTNKWLDIAAEDQSICLPTSLRYSSRSLSGMPSMAVAWSKVSDAFFMRLLISLILLRSSPVSIHLRHVFSTTPSLILHIFATSPSNFSDIDMSNSSVRIFFFSEAFASLDNRTSRSFRMLLS